MKFQMLDPIFGPEITDWIGFRFSIGDYKARFGPEVPLINKKNIFFLSCNVLFSDVIPISHGVGDASN